MRILWTIAICGCSVLHGQGERTITASQLVHEVIYNELHDHQTHGYWRFWSEKTTNAGILFEEAVETTDGPVSRLTFRDGKPLTAQGQAEENTRLERLMSSPEEQSRATRQHDEDEERIGKILAMLPDAFIYQDDGEENGCLRLRFQPKQDDHTQSIEERIFHSMSGRLWIDERAKRLVRLDGTVEKNVDFGFGILGRLYKGGWFRLRRVQVSATDWKTQSLEVHMNVRALMLKTFARDTKEVRGGFEPVPSGLSMRQAIILLNQPISEAQNVAYGIK